MNLNIASRLALFLAFSLSVIGLFVFLILHFLVPNFYLLAFFVLFIVSYFFIKFHFQKYINKHLKMIYGILYKDVDNLDYSKTLISIEEDAYRWKKEQTDDLNSLQKQNQYRKEFIGNLSHELKTPLFSIQGYIETLIDGGLKDDKINMAYLKKASSNIDRLTAIIKDVDLIAKVESDALNLQKSNFAINDLINETIESLELMADKNEIKVVLENNDKIYKVNADREKISAALVNLVANSIKYGKEGGNTRIKINTLVDRVLIEIIDNGMGIKKEQLPRIFERFYRVDSNRSRQQGGSGLGLSIVKHIIEAHHQTITVKSEYQVGTTFSFTLQMA